MEDAVAQISTGRIDVLLVDPESWNDISTGLATATERSTAVAVLVLGATAAPPAVALSDSHLSDAETLEAFVVGAVHAARSKRRRDTMVRWLERESCTDPLTGLLNRSGLEDHFDRLDRFADAPVSILLLNVVGTGMVNHNYGNDAGDRMIRRAARGIIHSIRGSDVSGRLEGDTFAVALADSNLDICRRVARRIAQELERMNTNDSDGDVPVSVTFGMACGTGVSCKELVALAEEQIREQRRFTPLARVTFRPDDDPSVA